ncbi:MalY/PatB family protein [Agaribacter flavus]|uniref:cysteine-S-conjugate beta-lyase n=1 Tax=Agaribacter flavus TaxID=1902781 RepID=A0ABV7FSL7_9ALTE
MYNFDTLTDRSPTHAFKWERYKGKDIIPTWVADTEFSSPQPIIDALVKRSQHGLFGYTLPKEYTPATDAIIDWCKKQYDWHIEADWIVWTPGVVPAFNMACKGFASDQSSIIVQTPNYPPLLAAPQINGKARLEVSTVFVDGRWTLDFDALEAHAAKPHTSLFILCNPMNPVGTVLNKEELTRIANICTANGVTVCSDEIHCDLILDDVRHIPAGKIPSLEDQSITLMAASKTFNVAGLGTSFAIIPNAKIRRQFVNAGAGIVPWVTVMGLVATEVAFTQCQDWLNAQLDYLRANRDYLVEAINNIDGLSCVAPEATFLLWVDASGLGVSDTQKWCEDRGVGPSPGRDFGQANFFRINYGCPRSMLESIVERLSK